MRGKLCLYFGDFFRSESKDVFVCSLTRKDIESGLRGSLSVEQIPNSCKAKFQERRRQK